MAFVFHQVLPKSPLTTAGWRSCTSNTSPISKYHNIGDQGFNKVWRHTNKFITHMLNGKMNGCQIDQNTHFSSSTLSFFMSKVRMGSKIIIKRVALCLNLLIIVSPELSTGLCTYRHSINT